MSLPTKNGIMIIKRERSDEDEAWKINQRRLDAVNYAKRSEVVAKGLMGVRELSFWQSNTEIHSRT